MAARDELKHGVSYGAMRVCRVGNKVQKRLCSWEIHILDRGHDFRRLIQAFLFLILYFR